MGVISKIKSRLFFLTLREFRKRGNTLSRGLRCSLAVTVRCPYRCTYCPSFIYGEPVKHDECSLEEWRVFLDRFPVWISSMCITGGEPGLYKDIVPLANYLVQRGYHVTIQTNLFKPEAFIGITPHWRLIFMATYHQEQEEKLGRGNHFYRSVNFLRKHGFTVISQQVGAFDKRNTRVKEFFTEKWFKEVDNNIMFAPSTPRTLRMWVGSINMYKK